MKVTNLKIKAISLSLIMMGLLVNMTKVNAQVVNFSGKWSRNNDKSESGDLSINSVPVTINIKQNANELIVNRNSRNGSGDTSSYTETLKFDGAASIAVTPSKLTRTATMVWSADQKSFTETFVSKDGSGVEQQSGKQQFSLSADGRELIIAVTQKFGDKQMVLSEVFEKQ